MEDDQQFCLRWNNHQSTLIQNFDTLLESGTLVDCTLAAEGKYLKAHKVVLSACSPYFEGLLSEHYDKHPVFILKDVKFKELKAMMDYMYRGEVNISQDQLTALLKAAESLQIKGLSDSRTGGTGGATTGRADTKSTKTASLTAAASSSVDIPHASSGLTIEKNSKVPRQSLQQVSVTDLPEDSASPQLRGLSSREGSQSPTRKRKRFRRRSLGNEDTTNSMENHEASNSSDVSMSTPALGVAPVADDKTHADSADSIGRSALMQQLTKPADEMLQIPIEKPEPSEEMIQPKSEYLDDQECVEDLTNLDDDMNDLNEMEQDNSRAGPSHDPSQHPGLASWHIAGDRSNASVVGAAAGPPGAQDDVFLAAHEAAQAQRDSQGEEFEGYAFTSITDADLSKMKSSSPRKKTSNISNPANRFYTDAINPEVIMESTVNLMPNPGDSRSQEYIGNLSNTEGNTESFCHVPCNQAWSLMNVRAWVEMYDRKQLRMSPLTNVLDSGVVEPGDRRELVRIAVAGMVEFNEGNLYPSCQLKTQLAKDIITAFPKLRSTNGGYEHFYDPKTNRGFIEFRLKTLRLKLNPSEKKRATSSQIRERKTNNKMPLKVVINEDLLDDDEFNSKVSQLFMKMPIEANKMEIFRLTEETRANRQKQIKTAAEPMTLSTILNIYPRFKDFEGELIRREFLAEYPHNDTFLDRFAAYYTPRILQYCSSTKPHLLQSIQDISDNNLKALILLPELLPSPNYTKRKENKTEPKSLFKVKPTKTIPNENLLRFITVSDETFLNEIYANKKSPFLLCRMANHERKGTFYIKTDGHAIQVGENAIVAFDVLLKLHYCFDIPFASDLVYFYDFITGCILQLNEPKGCCVALNSSLCNVTLTNIDSTNVFMLTQ